MAKSKNYKFWFIVGSLLLTTAVLIRAQFAGGADLSGTVIAQGAGKTIVEGGTGKSGGFVPVITTIAFHAERRNTGVAGAFECLALVPGTPAGAGSGIFSVNAMYVTGTIKTAETHGDIAVLTGTANITGLGAGTGVPFTFTVRQGGPGATGVLVTNGLTFNETLLEGQFQVGGGRGD